MQNILILPPMSGEFKPGAQDAAMRAAISAYKIAMHNARCEPVLTAPIVSTAHLRGEMRTNTLAKTLLRSGYTRLGRCRDGAGKLTTIYVRTELAHLYPGQTAAYRKLMGCEKN